MSNLAYGSITVTDLVDRGIIGTEDWYKVSNNETETFDGKNILELSEIYQGNFDVAGSTTNVSENTYIPIKPNTTYMWSQTGSVPGRYIRYYDETKTLIPDTAISQYNATNQTFTTPDGARYARFMWYRNVGLTTQEVIALNPQIELGDSATEYAPCNGWLPGILTPTADKKYLWFYEITTYSDGTTSTWGPVVIGTYGEQGAQGVGYTDGEARLFYLHDSSTSAPPNPTLPVTSTSTAAGVWTTKEPAWQSGKYYWTCHQFTKEDPSTTPPTITYSRTAVIYDSALSTANAAAAAAQATANSKNSITYGTTSPVSGDPPTPVWSGSAGDIYIQKSTSGTGGDIIWQWNSETNNWVQNMTGTTTIVPGSIGTASIAANAITANQLNTTDINASGILTIGALSSDVQGDIEDGASAYARATALRGTCSTGATYAAKEVTCTGFSLATGSAVTVYFTTANTKADAALTLNVNSTGAKTIYVASAATSDTNQLLWVAGSSLTFVYDGTYWHVLDSPGTWDGTECSVAADIAEKTTAASGVVIFKGTTISVPMTYDNANAWATLNVSSLGAKRICYGTTTLRPTTNNGRGWIAGRTVDFRFDGANWRLKDTGTIIDGGHITTGSIDAGRILTGTLDASQITVSNLSANSINSGTLNADRIKLGGEMTVYETPSSNTSGGSLGYMTGLTVDNAGTQTTTDGMAIKAPDNSHYIVVTTGGVRMTEKSGSSTYDLYLAGGVARTNATFRATGDAQLRGDVYLNSVLSSGTYTYDTSKYTNASNLLLHGGNIRVYNASESQRVYLGKSSIDYGILNLYNPSAAQKVSLWAGDSGGVLRLYGDTGYQDLQYGVLPVLLWQNSNQATFSATTLTSSELLDDLSKYNCFIVTCHQTNNTASTTRYFTTVCNMKDAALSDSVRFNAFDVTTGSSYQLLLRQREFTFNRQNNTIAITTGYYSNNGTSGTSYATTAVPISIYGMII